MRNEIIAVFDSPRVTPTQLFLNVSEFDFGGTEPNSLRNLSFLNKILLSKNATFLEPHLQGIRRRDSRSSDSDHDERSTEDDERSLLRSSPRTRLPPPPPPPPDDDPPPLKPREFFERLQTQAMREAQERKHRSRDLPIKDSNQLFRPVDADGSLGDSLSQVTNLFCFSFLQTSETLNHEPNKFIRM
ncbi:hypothetical protein HF086_009828 [Spodoptera exigua]|uniref:Uncharacterized protein n=1 Tax=Spodoptera exigua TaxID=7107 RepID=A0A922MX75_SPOEX|nr:hypothetical protein HF086_009828 [Spodoptera exigua]